MPLVTYPRPRPLTDFLDERGTPIPGAEASGTILSYAALDALAKARTYDKPCQLVAIAEERRADGKVWLTLGMNPEWIESETEYRFVDGERYPVFVCPECEGMRGKHHRGCSLA